MPRARSEVHLPLLHPVDDLAPSPEEYAHGSDRSPSAAEAAIRIQQCWREYRLLASMAAFTAYMLEMDRRANQEAAELDAQIEHRESARRLLGVLRRVWPIVREVLAVAGVAVMLIQSVPDAFSSLPEPYSVDRGANAWNQARSALIGAAITVVTFATFFLVLIVLYICRWNVCLYALHSLWICGLLGGPLATLAVRLCETASITLDKVTLVLLTWNVVVPGVLVVHWPATAARFELLRRCYSGVLSILVAWILTSVPYMTSLTALLMLAMLDVFLVSFPGSPVQRLDAIATARRQAGELQMPGLTFKHDGLELGLGDFIVYSAFAACTARIGVDALAATAIGVLVGLAVTMSHVALAQRRTVVPALPLSIALGGLLLGMQLCTLKLLRAAFADRHGILVHI